MPPLCQWKDMQDGTYTLDDVMRLNKELDRIMKATKAAK